MPDPTPTETIDAILLEALDRWTDDWPMDDPRGNERLAQFAAARMRELMKPPPPKGPVYRGAVRAVPEDEIEAESKGEGKP